MEDCEVLYGVFLRIQAANKGETNALVNLAAGTIQLQTQARKREVFAADLVAVQVQGCGLRLGESSLA